MCGFFKNDCGNFEVLRVSANISPLRTVVGDEKHHSFSYLNNLINASTTEESNQLELTDSALYFIIRSQILTTRLLRAPHNYHPFKRFSISERPSGKPP